MRIRDSFKIPGQIWATTVKMFVEIGLWALTRKVLSYIVEKIFWYNTYYLVDSYLQEMVPEPEAHIPQFDSITYHFVSSNDEADELAAHFEDFRHYNVNSRKRLDKGAVALCIYIDNEVGHVTWLAYSKEAMRTLNDTPFQVDFDNGEMYTGGDITAVKYRNKGLKRYASNVRNEYLKAQGIINKKGLVKTGNRVSQRALEKLDLGNIYYARARYIKLFGWKHWKESPIASFSRSDQQ